MNIIYRNSLSITFAILSLALSLILFNAAKKYLDLDQYIKLSIIIIFLVFFIINIFLKKNLQKKSFYLFVYVVLILYFLNTTLGVYSIYLDNQKKIILKINRMNLIVEIYSSLSNIIELGERQYYPI